MIEELQQFDDSVVTSLTELRRERDALRQRLARMQEAASDVSEKVLARVRSDYETRIAALDEKTTPLKDAARGTYGRLKPLLEKAREQADTLRLDKEELALRHRLGEFDDEAHRQKADELEAGLRAAESRVSEIAEFLARFQGAFDSPDEFAPATTSQIDMHLSVPPAGPGANPTSAPPPTPEEDGTLLLPPEPPPAPAPPPLPAASSRSTSSPPPAPPNLDSIGPEEPPRWVPSTAWSASKPGGSGMEEQWRAAAASPIEAVAPPASVAPLAPAALEPPAPKDLAPPSAAPPEPEPDAPTSGFATPAANAQGPRARLEALDGDLEPQPHFLEPLTFIGRTPENQIRIYKPAVSRRHAQITETEAGWMLRDLSSENGTYVNGQRITERLLTEGDRVQFGTSRYVLRITS